MKILMCGSRTWQDPTPINTVLLGMAHQIDGLTVIHGDARGADEIVSRLVALHGYERQVFHADWALHGRRAGYLRNQAMLDASPTLVWAFRASGPSPGTDMMVRMARSVGIPTYVVRGQPGATDGGATD